MSVIICQVLASLSEPQLKLLAVFLYLLHMLLIGFNLTGWIWKKTDSWDMLSVLFKALSWCAQGF